MPRPKRTKVAPSAPTAVPFLQKLAAEAQKDAVASKSIGNTTTAVGKGTFDDLYDVSDKENEGPERVPSSMPEEQSTATGITMSKVRSTPQTLQRKGSQHSAMHRRVQATPGRDSSMLSLGDFKRRSRQPSLLGIGRPDDTASLSSLGDGLSAEFDDLADFQPVDESTPLPARRAIPQVPPIAATTPVAQHARRKRKGGAEVQVLESREQTESGDEEDTLAELTIPATNSNRHEPDLPSPKRRAVTPPADSTMAPPQSPGLEDNGSESFAALERPTRARVARSQAKKAPSTAALQHLLPKRRRANRAQFHIASDATIPSSPTLPEEDDEITFAPSRKSKSKPAASQSKRAASGTQRSQALKATAARQGKASKSAARRAESEVPAARPVTRTYGRRSQGAETDAANDSLVAAEEDADDEVVGEESNESIELPRAAKFELAHVSAKFKAIDDWEMEFENVSGSLGSDSPGGAR